MTQYELYSFNPAFAKDIDYTGNGIMFSYNDPELLEQVKVWNADEAPEDIIISLTDSRLALYAVYAEDEEPEECFFALSTLAGLELLMWTAQEYGLDGEEAYAFLRRVLLRLAYEPTESGGISLEWLDGEQRKAVYRAYEASKAQVSA
ncbi:hypothetical protein SDC9_74040 [bioreactor metagenome]|uniref:Uncharacterized protein n=1 Tax=bioreactor metagenome TaxID=1076179 RepID=A0A644YHQ7_9ZZZZ